MSIRLPCKVNNLFIIVMDRARASRSIWFVTKTLIVILRLFCINMCIYNNYANQFVGEKSLCQRNDLESYLEHKNVLTNYQ